MLLPYMRILPSYGCGFTNTTDGRADPIRASLCCFGLPQALTYAPAAEARDIRVISYDAVLSTLIYRSRLTIEVWRAEMFEFEFDQPLFEFA